MVRASCAFLLLTLYFSMFSFYPPFLLPLSPSLSLSLSLPSLFLSFSLWLQDTCHLMPFTKYPLLSQSYFFTPYPSIAHINSPTIHRLSFTTTILRAAWITSFSLSGQPSSSFFWSLLIVFWCLRLKSRHPHTVSNHSDAGIPTSGFLGAEICWFKVGS